MEKAGVANKLHNPGILFCIVTLLNFGGCSSIVRSVKGGGPLVQKGEEEGIVNAHLIMVLPFGEGEGASMVT